MNLKWLLVLLLWTCALSPVTAQKVFSEDSRGIQFTLPKGFKPEGKAKPYKAEWRDQSKDWKLKFTAFEIDRPWERTVREMGAKKAESLKIRGADKAILFRGPGVVQSSYVLLARGKKYQYQWLFFGKRPSAKGADDKMDVQEALRDIARSARITK